MTVFRATGYGAMPRGILSSFNNELAPAKPKTLRALAKRFMAYRAAKLAADPSVDTFFNRGESATRFAYFDE